MTRWSLVFDSRGWHRLMPDGSTRPYRWYHRAMLNAADWWRSRGWRRRQSEFKRSGTRYYGDGGTIHSSQQLDVETDAKGVVVSVWFRCQPLPFRQSKASAERAREMRAMYSRGPMPELHGVEVRDPQTPSSEKIPAP